MPLSEGWHDQYERMRRSFLRLTEAAGPSILGSDDARDRLYHFFQDAYHLRDWLYNSDDPVVAAKASVLKGPNNYVKATSPLALCADICNGVKHFRLTTTTTGDHATTIHSQRATIIVTLLSVREFIDSGRAERGEPSEVTSVAHAWEIISAGQQYDAVQLASEIVATWESWLRINGLLS